jgi:hypothetical protein
MKPISKHRFGGVFFCSYPRVWYKKAPYIPNKTKPSRQFSLSPLGKNTKGSTTKAKANIQNIS